MSETKEKILVAVAGLLKDRPLDAVTTRDITQSAGVNIASINYHFGSRENLISQALDNMLLTGFNAWVEGNINLNDIKTNDLVKYVEFLLLSSIYDREITKTRIRTILDAETPNKVNVRIHEVLYLIIRTLHPKAAEKNLKTSATLLYSSLIAVSCSPGELSLFSSFDLKNPESVKGFVTEILTLTLGK